MNEKVDQMISENREVFTAMLNKYLDNLYETEISTTPEEIERLEVLRRKVIEGERVNELEFSLILLLITHALKKINNYKDMYLKASKDMTDLKENLVLLFEDYKT